MYSIVLCTCKNEKEARKIALEILKKKLAACVNIIPRVGSLYRWKGKIFKENESMMIIKTRAHLTDRLMSIIKRAHSYKVPEIIEIPVTKGSREYLDWMAEATSQGKP